MPESNQVHAPRLLSLFVLRAREPRPLQVGASGPVPQGPGASAAAGGRLQAYALQQEEPQQ